MPPILFNSIFDGILFGSIVVAALVRAVPLHVSVALTFTSPLLFSNPFFLVSRFTVAHGNTVAFRTAGGWKHQCDG
jgi:hypothetical protein